MKMLISISDRDLSKSISIYLSRLNIDNDIANDGIQALEKLTDSSFDYLLIEKDIVRLNAKELLEALKEKGIKVFSVCIIDKSTIDYSDLIDNDFDLIVPKPFDMKLVLDILNEKVNSLNSNDLVLNLEDGTIKFHEKLTHINLLEIKILNELISNKKIDIEKLNSIIKDDRLSVVTNYIESINYKLNKLLYPYNIKPIEKGYELVIL